MKLLKKLTSIQGASSDEGLIKNFVLKHIKANQSNWKTKPTILEGDDFQDNIILIFGKPRTAIYAHLDTIGFSVSYENQLVKIGGPDIIDGTPLVGKDSKGKIETELMVIEQENEKPIIKCVYERNIERGTILTYKPNFRESETSVQSPYLDNRLGVWCALKIAESLKDGVIVFSTYEEHGGNSVGFISKYLYKKFHIKQALICDITWLTEHITPGKGVVISLRDSMLPRKKFLNKIVKIAKKSGVDFQLEVESAGGSDGSTLQKSELLIDWCFIGAGEDNVHTCDEIVSKYDIMCMVEMYRFLMKKL
jgi:putative aminopeptidase FrvX